MEKPKISWHVLEEIGYDNYEYVQYKTYDEEGSFTPTETIEKTIQVWNNYGGTSDVANIVNCKLIISFKNFEDSYLLNLVKVQVEESDYFNPEIDLDKGIVDLGRLSGMSNNGSSLNHSNYKTIHFSIGPLPNNIKSELKSMYFYLEYEEEDASE